MAKQPISNYIYYTQEEAQAASLALGCTGYRTYLVDGIRVYLPCDEVADFERLTSYTIVKGMIVSNGNETFGGNLVGLQLTTNDKIGGDAFFTLGNFSINTTVVIGNKEQPFVIPDASQKSNTAESLTNLTGSDALAKLNKVTEDKTVDFVYDKTNFSRFTLFGSLSDKIKFSIIEISEQYPAALSIKPGTIVKPTIIEHSINTFNNTSSFKVNVNSIFNPFGLLYQTTDRGVNDSDIKNPLRNLAKYYAKYDLVYNNVRYDLLGFIGSVNNGPITLTVSGVPFIGKISVNNTLNDSLFIVPKSEESMRALNGMPDMAKYLLNKTDSTSDIYTAEFKTPIMDDNGDVIYDVKTLVFPQYDKYNIDLLSDSFDTYLTELNTIANDFDAYKTNLVSRFMTTDSLKEFDTPERRIDIILKSYGRTFDQAKQYIDALAFMTKVSYDKIENIPDLLLKNFAKTLGWKTYEIEDEETIVESLFDLSQDPRTDGDITPAELDIELWRRLLLNTSYLFKSKGTRKSVDAILKLVGVPELIYEINEYVYTAQTKLDYNSYRRKLFDLSIYPISTEGYPTVPNIYFQNGGGNVIQDSMNLGPYDFGKKYLDSYRKFGTQYAFDIYQTIDNKKSWAATDTVTNRVDTNTLTDTNYEIKDSRLVINTKNLDVFISLDRIIDSRVYKLFKDNNISIDTDLNPAYTKTINANELTFNSFLRECLSNYINTTNRKVIVTYPTLTKIYYDYIAKAKELGVNYADYNISLSFLQKYDSYWVDLIRQFIPATAILNSGKKISNSKLNDNKFQYLHGQGIKPVTGDIDTDLNWLGTDGSEFQQFTLKPVIDGRVEMVKNIGEIGERFVGDVNGYNLTGLINDSNSGYLNRGGFYDGNYFSLSDNCTVDFSVDVSSYTSTGANLITAALSSTLNIKLTDAIQITGAIGSGAQDYLNGTWKISSISTNSVTFYVTNSIPSGTYTTNIGNAIIADASYLTDRINFICPSPIPHVCYYNNTTISLPTAVFTNGSTATSSLSQYTSEEVDLTNLAINDNGFITATITSETNAYSGNFRIKDVLDFASGAQYSVFLELLYENLVCYNFLKETVIDDNLNPILELVFKQIDVEVSEKVSIELTPTLLNNKAIQTNVIKLNTLITCDGTSVDLFGTIKLSGVPSTEARYTRDLSYSINNAGDEAFMPNGPGQIKILGHTVHLTPVYSDSILAGTPPVNFIEDWFKTKYMIQQPKYYGLYFEDVVDKPIDAVTSVDGGWLVPLYDKQHKSIRPEYEQLHDRLTIDPFMHVPTIYESSFIVTKDNNVISVNLSENLNIKHIFAPNNGTDAGHFNEYDIQYTAQKAADQEINGLVYMSDSVSVNFDGMYATKATIANNGPGPIYNLNAKPSLTSHVNGDILCVKGVDTYIKLASPSSVFDNKSDAIGIGDNNASYYRPNIYQLFKFRAELIFDSEYYSSQEIVIKLVNQDGFVLAEFSNSISGSINPDYKTIESRTILVEKDLLVSPKSNIYWVVKSLDADCVVKEYEEIIINPQDLYDNYSFINIIPAQWDGSDKMYYRETESLGLPNMFLSFGNGGYSGDIGSQSNNSYLTDMQNFVGNFRYANNFYYDKIIFETVNELAYRTISISGTNITSKPDNIVLNNAGRFEYLPFNSDKVNSKTEGAFEYSINLINYSSAFDVGKYADFGSKNWGKYSSSDLGPNIQDNYVTVQANRHKKITDLINGKFLEYQIDPLDQAYLKTGPFGIDGMKNENKLYPFGLISINSVSGGTASLNIWPYSTVSTSGYTGTASDFETYAIVDTLSDPGGLTSQDSYNGSIYIVSGFTPSVEIRQLTSNSLLDYQTIGNWKVITPASVSESLFIPTQNQYPQLGTSSLLNLMNPSLVSADNNKISISPSLQNYKLATAFITKSGTVSGYLPRGLSNTYVKYQKKSHLWVYGSTISQFNNEMNLYSSSFKVDSNNKIAKKANMLTLVSNNAKTKNIDNNTLFEYSNAMSDMFKPPLKYGSLRVYNINSSLMAEYTIDKDPAGYPITGEFVGRLTFKDVCGNLATTLLRFFIINDSELINVYEQPTEVTDVTYSNTQIVPNVTATSTGQLTRSIELTCMSSVGSYGVNLTITEIDADNIETVIYNDLITSYDNGLCNYTNGNSLKIQYRVSDSNSTVSTIDISGIGDSWLVSGTSGTKTFASDKLTSDFAIIFNLSKIIIKK